MKLFNYHSGEYFNWFINNPLRTYWKVKKYFKPMTLHWYIGSKLMSPLPPYGYCAKILDIYSTDVIWKDKYNTPRHEYDPCISITLFNKWCIGCYWKFELNNQDYSMQYWESILDYLYYDYTNPIKAVDNNIWENCITKERTPVREFLKLKAYEDYSDQ